VIVTGCDLNAAFRALEASGEQTGGGRWDYERDPDLDLVSVTLDADSGQEAEARVRKVVGEDCEVRLAEPTGEGDLS
jgi:hypothetical protein